MTGVAVPLAVTPASAPCFGSFVIHLPAQQKLVEHLLGTDSSGVLLGLALVLLPCTSLANVNCSFTTAKTPPCDGVNVLSGDGWRHQTPPAFPLRVLYSFQPLCCGINE